MKRRSRTVVLLAGLVLALVGASARLAGQDKAPDADTAILQDWMRQDSGGDPQACFAASDAATLETRMVARVVDELGAAGAPYRETLEQLTRAGAAGNDPRWRDLYAKACDERRRRRLGRLVAAYPKIVFTKHYDIGGSHYAYTEGQSDAQAERHFRPGSALCLLELGADGAATVRTLIDDPKGVIRDPDVSYDGARILFAWKKSDRQDDYHLYEMDARTEAVRQLTFGLGFADYEGVYLPGGDILFNSTRCVQIVDCWWTEVSNLYACDPDGRYLRRLSFDQVHTNYPQVLDDGRVVYTRWDYNDRGQIYPQPLFQMNPDGTAQTEFYGNNSWFPTTIMHARGIPGTHKVIAVLSGHHSRQRGKLAIVDASRGQQEATGVQLIAPVRETKAVHVDSYGQDGDQWQYPYALSETEFVVTYAPGDGKGKHKGPFGLYWMDIDGRRELLACDPKISCNQPVPLVPRAMPHLRPSVVDYRKNTGVYYVKDVYAGPGLAGLARGTVKRLRVVALDFRAAGVGANGSGGPGGGALSSTPPSCRNGTWDVKKVLGSVPVHDDGSALFTVPARRPVYFQLLDARSHVVQSMRSWSTLQPGEVFSCVGCHESKGETSSTNGAMAAALREGPQDLEPFYGPTRGFSFPREVQPILDKHCVRCHNDRAAVPKGGKAKAGPGPALQLKNARPVLPIESEWQYTTADPGRGWQKPEFDSSRWKTGLAGFGTRGTPGGNVCTDWRTREIWLRTSLTLPADWRPEAHTTALRHCHDEDIEVTINGIRVFGATGHIVKYEDALIDSKALRPGRNVIAVNCRQTGGGQFIDVGILAAPAKGADTAVAKTVAPPPLPPGVKKAFSLLDERSLDKDSKRMWSDSYLALTQKGTPNRLVRWLNVQSIPPMLPPYFAGAAKSELVAMLEAGHNGVKLSREEMDKITCWIDLLVPFCGDYTEANAWNEDEKKKYAHFMAKRAGMEAMERENIAALVAQRTGGGATTVAEETAPAYRNVALNPKDVQGAPAGYPHASSNSEFGGTACFAARCAIDGKTENKGHGDRFPSWGPDKRKDLWWMVEFGQSVEIDKIVVYLRADFPHDMHWKSAVIQFSDGTREKISIDKTAEPQTFAFDKRTVSWLKITDLVQDEPLGWCALTEVQVWGRDAKGATARVAAMAPTR